MNKKNNFSALKWIFFVSQRFASVDKKGSVGFTNFLSSLGIAFGVMTLISVLSVMNGFQGTSINSILAISSYHIQVSSLKENEEKDFYDFCSSFSEIKTCQKMYESQALVVGPTGKQAVSLVKAVPSDILKTDEGFQKELSIYNGDFDLQKTDSVILGFNLAQDLRATVGSEINFLALSGSTDTALISQNRKFIVTGIFQSQNVDINQTFAFINHDSAKKYFGKESEPYYAIKIKNYSHDAKIISKIKEAFPNVECLSWKSFNKSFFSTLRIEKDMLFLLVMVIFVVVGINIYNGIRRLVYERSKEIAILSATGANKMNIKMIFIVKGLLNGIKGSFLGTALGLLISKNIGSVFIFLSEAEFYFQYFITSIFSPQNLPFLTKNSSFELFASIPAVSKPFEVFVVCLFGILTPLISSWFASKNILKMNISEVLHE